MVRIFNWEMLITPLIITAAKEFTSSKIHTRAADVWVFIFRTRSNLHQRFDHIEVFAELTFFEYYKCTWYIVFDEDLVPRLAHLILLRQSDDDWELIYLLNSRIYFWRDETTLIPWFVPNSFSVTWNTHLTMNVSSQSIRCTRYWGKGMQVQKINTDLWKMWNCWKSVAKGRRGLASWTSRQFWESSRNFKQVADSV